MKSVFLVLPFLAAASLSAQIPTAKTPPFANDIAAFKQQDEKNPPAKGQILLIGSSSFTRWTDVQSYFPSHPILNRAFGGSTLLDEIRYVNDVVFPYQPRQILIYCGENDFAAEPKLAPKVVFDRFKTLYGLIRKQLPVVPIVYVSMKPSPSRWNLAPKFTDANGRIRDFMAGEANAVYIDVWPVMLNEQGDPKPDIFVGDKLHMNAAGYRLWAPLIEPILK